LKKEGRQKNLLVRLQVVVKRERLSRIQDTMNVVFPKRIAILYSDAKREYFPTEQLFISEVEVKERAGLVAKYLEKMKIEVALFPGDSELAENLKKFRPDFVLNLVDSVFGKEYLAAAIPGTLELLNIPYTGTGMMGLTISANKYFTKNLLRQRGITVPKYQLITDPSQEIENELDYPLISKLNEVHGSIEIDESAISHNEKALRKRLDFLMKTYKQGVLLEEFIVGREITVIITEGINQKVYTGEKIFGGPFADKFKIVTFEANWNDDSAESNAITYKKYEMPERAREMVKEAFDVLKMEDYGKFDIRLDESGRHYIIDANHNPTFGPKEVGCAMGTILNMYDISFEEILERLITNTVVGKEKKNE